MAKNFTVIPENNSYRVEFPYNPTAVALIKRYIPNTGRSWDGVRKCWIIAGQYKREAENALGVTFPDMVVKKPVIETRLLEIRYIGQCKERAPGEVSAMGLLKNGAWGVIFPMETLTTWFEDGGNVQTTPDQPKTLYSVLGAKQSDGDEAIKKAYFRMAKQWHPDVCKEPNANEMFLRIREAYDILRVPRSRGRYDAGLALEATLNNKKIDKGIYQPMSDSLYRSPLRCGWIMAEGVETIGRFVVSKILGWEDITQGGKTLVVSWKSGDDGPTEVWA